jgi:hypothetical protein
MDVIICELWDKPGDNNEQSEKKLNKKKIICSGRAEL